MEGGREDIARNEWTKALTPTPFTPTYHTHTDCSHFRRLADYWPRDSTRPPGTGATTTIELRLRKIDDAPRRVVVVVVVVVVVDLAWAIDPPFQI